LGGDALRTGHAEQRVEIGVCGFPLRMRDGLRSEKLPELSPSRESEARRLHGGAPAPGGLSPARKTAWNNRLDLGTERLREHGRSAVGRDTNDERGPVDDRPE